MQIEDMSGRKPANEFQGKRTFGARAKTIWNWVEVAFLLLGIVLLAWFAGARFESYLSSRSAIESFDRFSETWSKSKNTATEERHLEPASAAQPEFKDWDESRVRAYKRAASGEANKTIAVLEIPRIHLVAPVMEGTDGLTLNHAVGRIPGTARPDEEGNIGLAGHRDSFFRGLKDIRPGDKVELRTNGETDIYTIDRTQIVTPSDVSVLRPQPVSALTLVTCYPFYFIGSAPKRFVVTAYLTQHSPGGQATTNARAN